MGNIGVEVCVTRVCTSEHRNENREVAVSFFYRVQMTIVARASACTHVINTRDNRRQYGYSIQYLRLLTGPRKLSPCFGETSDNSERLSHGIFTFFSRGLTVDRVC